MPILPISLDEMLFMLKIITEAEKRKASDIFKAAEDISPTVLKESKIDLKKLKRIKNKIIKESKKTTAWEHVKIFLKIN